MATQRGRARSHCWEASKFPLCPLPSLFEPLRRLNRPSPLVLKIGVLLLRCLDRVAGANPRIRAASDIDEISEAVFLHEAGGCA